MILDRARDDTSNIVHLEHVNLTQPDQRLATLFYIVGLQFTRDPYLMVGVNNMWVNIGRSQMHLPTRDAQRLRGTIGLVVPDLDLVEASLAQVAPQLEATEFGFERQTDLIAAHCPWGNRFRLHAPDPERWGQMQLGMAYVEFDVPTGAAIAIADFYRTMLDAPAEVHRDGDGRRSASVRVGADQRLDFVETNEPLASYDGHHIQIYLADFSGPYRRLKDCNLITRDTDPHEWRFIDIVDLDSAARPVVFQLEHEVRSMRHPLFGRPLVNRNPQQSNAAYIKGHDAFRGTI
ncbi:MAG: glyoxalase/bleomycin resistance/dioxygenase family protein [Burkholderiales bacterium]